MSDKWNSDVGMGIVAVLIASVTIFPIAISAILEEKNETKVAITAMENGYEQVVVDGVAVWRKISE